MSDSVGKNEPADGQWVAQALSKLVEMQNEDSSWGYRAGGDSSAEPTALACLALLANRRTRVTKYMESVERAAAWLGSIQQADGSVGVSSNLPVPRWPTAYGLLTWTNLPDCESFAGRALAWLLNQRGEQGSETDLVSHNPKLQGWPWLSETHSWIEPTAVAVLALRRAGLTRHPRTEEGISLILDRAIAGGGWNYGNRWLFGKDLRPQPATTGLVLMALADLEISQETVSRACSYLVKALETVRSPMSLCWGLLGLAAWNHKPVDGEKWLREGFERLQSLQLSTAELAYLLLATGERAWETLAPISELQEV